MKKHNGLMIVIFCLFLTGITFAAYTNAIYYMDYDNGVDTARADLVPSAYADNGVGLVRVTVGAYDTSKYVTDSVVTIAGTTGNVYAGSWKMTQIDNTHLDLQGSTFTSNPASKGTCIPNGGGNWADAWKTTTSGATAARIAPGDTIRIAKSADPTSIGNATWTNNSKTVTLDTAQTITIWRCENNASPFVGADCTPALNASDFKEGSTSQKLTLDSSVQINTLQATYNIADIDFTGLAYTSMTLWIKNSAAIAANTWTIYLCDDDGGTSGTDQFVVPAIPSTGQWVPLNITRFGGGNIQGNAGTHLVKSITFMTLNPAPANSSNIFVDNIEVCTSGGLNLQSLISKNSLATGGDEGWYPIQSIVGTAVKLDCGVNALGNSVVGYYQGSNASSLATYKRETIKTAMASAATIQVQVINDSGTSPTNMINFQGGYNTSNNSRDGETFFDGLNGMGYAIRSSSKNYLDFSRLSFCRYQDSPNFIGGTYINFAGHTICDNTGYALYTSSGVKYFNFTYTNIVNNCLSTVTGGAIHPEGGNFTINITNLDGNNSGYGAFFNEAVWNDSNVTITNMRQNYSNYATELYFNAPTMNTNFRITNLVPRTGMNSFLYNPGTIAHTNFRLYNCTESGANTYGVGFYTLNAPCDMHCIDCSLQASALHSSSTNSGGWIYIENRSTGNDELHWPEGTAYRQNGTRVGYSGKEWMMTTTSVAYNYAPLRFKMLPIHIRANKLCTLRCYAKTDDYTKSTGKLIMPAGQIAGVTVDKIAAITETDNAWHRISVTFTPTEAGMITPEFWAWYVTGAEDVRFDSVEIMQAN